MDSRNNSSKRPSRLRLWSNDNIEAAIRAVTNNEMGVNEVLTYQQLHWETESVGALNMVQQWEQNLT